MIDKNNYESKSDIGTGSIATYNTSANLLRCRRLVAFKEPLALWTNGTARSRNSTKRITTVSKKLSHQLIERSQPIQVFLFERRFELALDHLSQAICVDYSALIVFFCALGQGQQSVSRQRDERRRKHFIKWEITQNLQWRPFIHQ